MGSIFSRFSALASHLANGAVVFLLPLIALNYYGVSAAESTALAFNLLSYCNIFQCGGAVLVARIGLQVDGAKTQHRALHQTGLTKLYLLQLLAYCLTGFLIAAIYTNTQIFPAHQASASTEIFFFYFVAMIGIFVITSNQWQGWMHSRGAIFPANAAVAVLRVAPLIVFMILSIRGQHLQIALYFAAMFVFFTNAIMAYQILKRLSFSVLFKWSAADLNLLKESLVYVYWGLTAICLTALPVSYVAFRQPESLLLYSYGSATGVMVAAICQGVMGIDMLRFQQGHGTPRKIMKRYASFLVSLIVVVFAAVYLILETYPQSKISIVVLSNPTNFLLLALTMAARSVLTPLALMATILKIQNKFVWLPAVETVGFMVLLFIAYFLFDDLWVIPLIISTVTIRVILSMKTEWPHVLRAYALRSKQIATGGD